MIYCESATQRQKMLPQLFDFSEQSVRNQERGKRWRLETFGVKGETKRHHFLRGYKMNTHFIAGLGSSAGGLDALKEFFSHVERCGNVSYVVVSHLPIDAPTRLHVLLSQVTDLRLELLRETTHADADCIYVLPGSLRVKIIDGTLMLRPRGREEIINKAIDEFLFSLAEDQRDKAVAIILADMGSDGADGAQRIHENGGLVFVQDPVSTPYKAMPLAAIDCDDPNEIQTPKILAIRMQQILADRGNVRVNLTK